MVGVKRARLLTWAALVAACSGDPIGPTLAACHSTVQPLALSVGQFVAIDPQASGGCVIFPATSTDSAAYLLVPQLTTDSADSRTSFKLTGGVPVKAASPLAALYQPGPLSPAERFHNGLRVLEETRGYGMFTGAAAAPRLPIVRSPARAIMVGDKRTFKVLASLTNGSIPPATVGAAAVSVGQHVAIFVDTLAPANGLTQTDFDGIRSKFDTLLYPIDTTAFGRESDIDGNGVVLVLMTNVVNSLVTAQQCDSTGYVGGYFFGADIDPAYRAQWNNGELFYTLVADPNGTLSCAHSVAQLQRVVPVTFIHEFQHMISYNQHVLIRGGTGEVLWLNEGLSHYAEERGGRSFLAAGDSLQFCNHVRGDLYNFALYVSDPATHPVVDLTGIGGLSERGAFWSLVRFVVDQFSSDTSLAAGDALTRRLDQTSTTGSANVTHATGEPFATVLERWSLANWATDAGGFTPPDSARYRHWAFRSDIPTLYTRCQALGIPPKGLPDTFPIVTVTAAGPTLNVSGTMWTGSPAKYVRAVQPPGSPGYGLLFSDGSGAELEASLLPRLNILRIR